MSAGLFGLLDDVATLAKMAAASLDDVGAATGRATAKAAGVVVDDTAVTPQYVHGIAAHRELPIVRRIAVGSLRNKLLVILPIALLLSHLLPGLLAPLLMLGGTYLAFEGAEKVWESLSHDDHQDDRLGDQPTPPVAAPPDEESVVRGAVRTDLILSAEIMVIALDAVTDQSFWAQLVILVAVALVITVGVYGAVGVLVKMDDIGLALAERGKGAVARFGTGLVEAMPRVLSTIAVVGTAAMLWVGGHILVVQADEVGWHAPYELLHHVEHSVHHALDVPALGPTAGWLAGTVASALVGLVIGAAVVVAAHLLRSARRDPDAAH